MNSQLIVGLIEVAFDGRILDGAVHFGLDLPIRPGMLGLGQPMIDIIEGAQAYSKAWARKGFRLAIMSRISAGDHASPAGSVKWVPLSVRTRVWTR